MLHLQFTAAFGPASSKHPFQVQHVFEVNIRMVKLAGKDKVCLKNANHSVINVMSGEVNVTLHLEDDTHTIWAKAGDVVCVPNSVDYDLELVTDNAVFYLYLTGNQTDVSLR